MRKVLLTIVVIAALAPDGGARAQTADPTTYRLTGARIAVGQDVTVERDEEVTDAAVVIGGTLTVDGRVRDGAVVVGGDLRLGPTADVRGDIVLVGGQLVREEGARHDGSINYVTFGSWSWRSMGWLPRVEFGDVGRWLGFAGTFARVSVLAVLMLLLLLVARAPVARAGRAALATPLRSGLVGIAAIVLFVPVLVATSIGLAITIIGIPFVAVLLPIAIAIAAFTSVLGFTAVACRLGERVEDVLGWTPGSAVLATAMGFFLILGPTLVAGLIGLGSAGMQPVALALLVVGVLLETVAWTVGIGAAILTGLGRWYTVPPPITAGPDRPAASAAY
jgi:hypothetical protein